MSSSPGISGRHSGRLSNEHPVLGRVGAAAILFACVLLAGGCGSSVEHGVPLPQPPPSSAPPVAGQSGSVTISPEYVALAQKEKVHFAVSAPGPVEWLVNGIGGGNSDVGTIDSSGNYTAPAFVVKSENVIISAALAASPQQNYATSVASIIVPGYVACPGQINNPQVAQYVVYLPAPGKVHVDFGTSTSYGLKTWSMPTPSPNGGQVRLYVAGMLGQTQYHMRGRIVLDDGATFTDIDQTCKTGKPPATSPGTIARC